MAEHERPTDDELGAAAGALSVVPLSPARRELAVGECRRRAGTQLRNQTRLTAAGLLGLLVLVAGSAVVWISGVVAATDVPDDVAREAGVWEVGVLLARYMDDAAVTHLLSQLVLVYVAVFLAYSFGPRAVPLGPPLRALSQLRTEICRPEPRIPAVHQAIGHVVHHLLAAPPSTFASSTARGWQSIGRRRLAIEFGRWESTLDRDGLDPDQARSIVARAWYALVMDAWPDLSPEQSLETAQRPTPAWRKATLFTAGLISLWPVVQAWQFITEAAAR